MGIAWLWNKEAFKRSAFESLLDKVVREILPGRDSRKRRAGGATKRMAKTRRQNFTLEAIEPRLLLSADLSYGPSANVVGATDFWVRATDSTHVGIFTSATNSNAGDIANPLQLGPQVITDGTLQIEREATPTSP